MDHILNLLLPMIVPTIASAIASFVAYEIHKLFALWRAKISGEKKWSAMDRLEEIAETVVLATEQTIVKDLKRQGRWTGKAAYDQALGAAMQNLKEIALRELPELAASGSADLDNLLRQIIEAQIKRVTI